MLTLKTEGFSFTYETDSKNPGMPLLQGEAFPWDLRELAPGKYHAVHQDRSYELEVVSLNREEKTAIIRVNGRDYTFSVKDRFDLLLAKMGMESLGATKASDIKAPMPGLVLDILAEPGTEVKKGDAVAVLEAMKMENILKSPADGTVKAVKVEKGAAVEKNEVIIQFA